MAPHVHAVTTPTWLITATALAMSPHTRLLTTPRVPLSRENRIKRDSTSTVPGLGGRHVTLHAPRWASEKVTVAQAAKAIQCNLL